MTGGIVLTYSAGNNYVTNKNGSFYYVQSMTFTVDSLQEEYVFDVVGRGEEHWKPSRYRHAQRSSSITSKQKSANYYAPFIRRALILSIRY